MAHAQNTTDLFAKNVQQPVKLAAIASPVVTNSAAADASAQRHAVHRIEAANLHQSGQAADGDAL